MPYEIVRWSDLAKGVAPAGAKFFRYRRATGERRKFYEKGYAFPIDPSGINARVPAHSDGLFNVTFYTEEEAAKPAAEAAPIPLEAGCDELQVEFPKNSSPDEALYAGYLREQLATIKDLAVALGRPNEQITKVMDRISEERDQMALEAERNRFGPFWTLVLEHSQTLGAGMLAILPAVQAFALKLAAKLNEPPQHTTGQHTHELRELQEEQRILRKNQEEIAQALTKMSQALATMAGAGAPEPTPSSPKKPIDNKTRQRKHSKQAATKTHKEQRT